MERSRAPTNAQREAAIAMTALSHPRRIMIFELLCAAPDGVSYTELRETTGFATPTLDHHLRPMRLAKIVVSRRKGAQVIYRLAPDALTPHLSLAQAQAAALKDERRARVGIEKPRVKDFCAAGALSESANPAGGSPPRPGP